MRPRRYLNVILTINAVLLTALLWTAVAGQPLLTSEASAQSRTKPFRPVQWPNAAGQRAEMVNELKAVRSSVDALSAAIKGGEIKVVVTNASELRAAAGD